ncbi:hypothetical protein AWJ14_14795 [Hoeflea olei]|uniref:Sensor protein FixL n=2 Tax=Hoeflea olei TaxID=1480615 RepID=A0A1C1YQB7_9HYPH|nr:hypothetical protein AWJ14_14795 [Hoeflea olei]
MIGLTVISLWWLRLEQVAQKAPVILAMQFNTALCLVMLGLSFILAAYGKTLLVYALTAATALVAALSLYQDLSGATVGVDTLFNTPFVAVGTRAPGRMAPNTALCFLLSAIGIALPRIRYASQARLALGFIVLGIATVALLGYAVQIDRAHDWFGPARMSPHTSFGFLLLGGGLIYLGAGRSANHVRLTIAGAAILAYLAVLALTYLEFRAQEMRLALYPGEGQQTLHTLSTLILVSGLIYLSLAGYAFWYSQRYRRSAAALAASKAELAGIIDNAVDGIVSIDTGGTILSVNPACEKMFGYRRDEMIGRNVKMLMPRHYSDHHDSYIANYHRTGEAKIIGIGREMEGLRKDGSVFPLDLAVARISLANGVFYSGIVRDISVRKRAEAQLLEANGELEEFAYRTSHDLRSPIASSLGLVRIARDLLEKDDHDMLSATLRRLETNSERLEALIQNIIAVTRSRLLVEDPVRLSVDAVIAETRDGLSHLEGFSEVRIECDIEPGLWLVCKPVKFRMIIASLLSNAIKYRDPDEAEPRLLISTRHHSGTVRIAFIDNGLGIPPEARPMVFGMFRRFHPDRAFGSGLGLYILKKSTEALNGTVTYEALEKGSSFAVELPQGETDADAKHPGR